MIAYFDSMTRAEAHEALRDELARLAPRLTDVAETFAALGLPSYADVALEMSDTCLTQSLHLAQLAVRCVDVAPLQTPDILTAIELEVAR